MDNNSHLLETFEEKLKQHSVRKPARLYSSSDNGSKPNFRSKIGYNSKDIIQNISAQIKAMQNADCVIEANRRINKALAKHKTACFMPVNEFQTSVVPHPKAAKFETQFVIDTQFMNVIEDVEAMSTHKGITQEFEHPFDHTNLQLNLKPPENKVENCLKTTKSPITEKEVIFCTENEVKSNSRNIHLKTHSSEEKHIKNSNEYELSNNKTSLDDNCTALLNKCIEIEDNVNIQDIITDTDINPSPIISINKGNKSISTSPLVFNLDTFEKFEKLALPIIEENDDIETVKHLINSQIIGKELFIHTDFEPELVITEERLSPVLKISKTPKIIKHDLALPSTSCMKYNSYEKSKKKGSENIDNDQDNETESNHKLNLIGNTLDNFTEIALIGSNKQEKKSIDFEDEILFSSDEEQDIKQTNLMDLPFTCALETSFYEHSDVLDTTMYVGFQTASNKSIQISTVSFTKAKSILDDETDGSKVKVPTLKELVEKCDNNPKVFTIISGNTSVNKVRFNKNEETKEDSYEDFEVNTTNDAKFVGFKTADGKAIEISDKNVNNDIRKNQSRKIKKIDGFKTASNKNINLSEKALRTCKRVFQDIDLDENFCKENLSCEIEPCAKRLKNSLENNEVSNNDAIKMSDKECGTDIPKIDEDILQEFEGEMSFHDNANDKDNEFIGFKTASNKNIKISVMALAKSKKIFEDIDSQEITSKNMSIKYDVISSESKGNEIVPKHINIGFKTASNKIINISDQALAKTRNIFQDIETNAESISSVESVNENRGNTENAQRDSIDENRNHVVTETRFVRFKTASNKMIKVSEQAITKSEYIFQDIERNEAENINFGDTIMSRNETVGFCRPSKSKESFMEFKTANNKNITVSAAALEKTKKIFQDLQSENNNFTEDFDVAKLIQDKKLSEEFNNDFQQSSNTSKLCENLKGKDTLDIIFKDNTVNDLPTNNDKFGDITKADAVKTKIVFQDILNKKDMPKSNFKGFQTASNKKIQISADALANGKKLFEDMNEEKYKTALHGFQTDGNKEVKFSDQVLAKSKKNMFEDIEKSNGTVNKVENNSKYPLFKGFQTASNKEVKISAQALAKSKKIFEDLDEDNKNINEVGNIIPNPTFKGFQTASNKEVKISAQALAKSKKIFENLDTDNEKNDEVVNISPSPVFKGFHTASKKQLEISAAALGKNRNIFENIDTVLEKDSSMTKVVRSKSDIQNLIKNDKVTPSFISLQTASKKEVKMSPAPLERTKMIFQGIDSVKENAVRVEKNIAKPAFLGFQTASNKEVKISSEALAKSKRLFKEYDRAEENNGPMDIFHETERNERVPTSFKGFQTASNKEVKISAEALAKSKQIFQDLSDYKENEFNITSYLENQKEIFEFKGFKTASDKKVVISEDALNKGRQILSDIKVNETKIDFQDTKPSFSFKSANNNEMTISEQALLRSKKLFTELDNSEDIPNSGIIKLKTDVYTRKRKLDINIEKLIDTQVIKNFDESLNTEDFKSPENRSKRSGSPILSCPKAKKRKFATPYKKVNVQDVVKPLLEEVETYDDSYKKNKKYTLRDIAKLENENTNEEVTTDLILNDTDLNNFEFTGKRNDISETKLSLELLKAIFLKAVNRKLVPDNWYENHVKLIIWKLISYEVKFPKMMSGICTAKNVLLQLKYRYFKELYSAERPALRKILEKDDVASKTLVLCVKEVYNQGGDNSATNPPELLLTDGWYTIRACIDKMLAKHVNDGKIRVGMKIVTQGAELLGCEQGVAPWEDTSSTRLKIFGNSTRRARWHARLGYHASGAILSHLTAVKPEGGKVTLRVIVTRVYPPLFVEKFEDGSTVTRSERLENIHQMKYEADRQAMVEKIYEEVEKEMTVEESPDSEDMDLSKRSLDSGSQIARLLRLSKEPSQFRANLTESQRRLLESYTATKRDKILQDIQDKMRSKLTVMTRNVVPLLKVRVADLHRGKVGKALLTIWKPNDAMSELITEGAVIEILNVVPTAIRYSELQLSAGRQTIFKQTDKKSQENLQPYIKSLTRTCYPIKDLVTHPSMSTDYNEIDTVGMVIQIDPSHTNFTTTNQFQNVYMTDEERNIICVNFWGGIKKFGFENVLDTGQIVACVNLQKRAGNTRKNIPQYRATEFTYFTKTPKNVDARHLVEELSKKVLRNKDFIDKCVAFKDNLLKCNVSNENVSPYRFYNHDISKNKIYIESPLARIPKAHDEFNLSGLDFESTFRQTEPQELSPKSLLRKKRIQEKISKLKMYGEPPPLSPINIINKSKNATKSFKSPLVNTSIASRETPVASAKKLPENVGENELNCSPVLGVKRTYKKGVNPVKLDFNSAIDENDSVDHFAEEFDASPPLSLD